MIERADKDHLRRWPGPIVTLYAARAEQNAMLAAAAIAVPTFNRIQQCEAHFFLGEYFLIHGEKQDAAKMFDNAIADKVMNSVYYYGAKAERARLDD